MSIAVALLLLSRAFWTPYWIPSGSMKPTLLIGDYVIVVPYSEEPQRGDVIVFRHPVSDTHFIQRLIGLPGESVQITGGIVFVNGSALPQEPDGTFVEVFEPQGPFGNLPRCANGSVPAGADCTASRQRELLPDGTAYRILNLDDNQPNDDEYFDADNTGVFVVPEGHYFFVGDHRDNSIDSRFPQESQGVGFVPRDNLIGQARMILFSAAGSSLLYFWTWRADRYLEIIE